MPGRGAMGLLVVGVVLALSSCAPGGGAAPGTDRMPRSVTFHIDRGAEATARNIPWSVGEDVFLPSVESEGVLLGCDSFGRVPTADDLAVQDSGLVYVANATGGAMYDTVAEVRDVAPDTDGTVKAIFDQTRYEYGDMPDGASTRDHAQLWSYVCTREVSETYLPTLRFTVKVSWLADP